MEYSRIESLIADKSFNNALLLITEELNKSYDFGIKEEKDAYDRLSELLVTAQEALLDELNNSLGQSSATRSFTGSRTQFSNRGVNSAQISTGMKRIKIERSGYDYIPQTGDVLLVLIDDNLEDSALSNFGIPREWLSQSETGEFLATIGLRERSFYALNALSVGGNRDLIKILIGFVNAIETLTRAGTDDVKIFFIANNPISKNDTIYYIYTQILLHILYIISFNVGLSKDLIFTFLFKNDDHKRTFERSKIRIDAPVFESNVLRNYSKERAATLAEKVLTNDPNYKDQLDSIVRIIDEEFPILICGDSGVGKSYLAKIIHKESIRREKRFEQLNCGSLLVDKLEQNLFGWVKGAFTGSINDKKGKIALAEGGTLFLDEIHRSHISVRNALLTFIEDKRYTVMGKEDEEEADIRMVFGTNKDLKKLIQKREFEEDFYFRISSRKITIPPLCERKNDIRLIAKFKEAELNQKYERDIKFEDNAIDLLLEYSWPGNTRELSTYLETRYTDCIADNKNIITVEMIKAVPYENISYANSDDLETLKVLLKKFLDNWDINKGDIMHRLIAPIFAKLYIDESFMHWNRTTKFEEAMKVVGMGGKEYSKSALQRYYDEFSKISERLGIDE